MPSTIRGGCRCCGGISRRRSSCPILNKSQLPTYLVSVSIPLRLAVRQFEAPRNKQEIQEIRRKSASGWSRVYCKCERGTVLPRTSSQPPDLLFIHQRIELPGRQSERYGPANQIRWKS